MIGFFARHPTAANLLMMAFLAAGVLGLSQLRRETFPDITPNEVQVQILYPGATAEEVEEAVCQRVEDAVDGVKFVKEVRSDARENVAVVIVEMEDGGDFQTFLVDIQSAVDAIDEFPSDVEEPIVSQLGATDPVLTLVVAGPMTPPDLKAHCQQLKDRLQQLPEISLVRIEGFSDHQLRIELSSTALMRYGLSAADVASIVERQSVDLPAGVLESREQDILIRFVEERRSPIELADLIVVAGQGGAEVRLSDIAVIRDRFEADADKVLLDGRRAGKLVIEKTKNQDVIRVSNVIKEFVEDEQVRYPAVDIRVTQDTSTLVIDRLQMLTRNAMQGVVLVFFTLWLFFNLRLSFWVVMSLPVSFLAAFFFMPAFGLTINMLTMVSLLLALGLLMDDGIVIAENIAAHLSRGKPAMQAAIDGVSEVKAGVFSSFLTTVCVLGPLAALEGDIGKVLKVVPLLLILVLAISLVEAFLILPAHLGHSLERTARLGSNRFRRWFDERIESLRSRVIGPAVDWALRWRYFTVGSLVGVFLISISMMAGGVVKFIAFPDLDGDVVVARLLMPPGTPLERTAAAVDQITGALDRVNDKFVPRQPDQQDLVKTVVVQFNENMDALETGPHVATVTADLLDAETRDARVSEVLAAWREETGVLPDALDLILTEPTLGPAGRPIELRLSGNDLSAVQKASAEVRQWLAKFTGVYNLTDDLRRGKPELRIRLREGALGLGLDGATVARQLRAAFQGATADEIQIGPESYEIDVQLRGEDQDAISDLETFYFTTATGAQVPLAAAAEVRRDVGWSRIARINGVRTVTVRGEVDVLTANTADILGRLKQDFLPELAERNPEVNFNFEGETKEAATTQRSMMRNMLLGLLGVFVLLSFQFRSYVEPFTVMTVIPLSLIGVIWGHLIMGVDVSMPSMLGFASLAGIVVNDSILLVLFLKAAREEGADILEACGQASRLRFRAILLTSLTTIAGLLPLLAERSLQAQVLIPLAVSIAFGLAASTVLVLVAVPCIYAIFADFGWTTHADRSH
ncbi:efflux RND transporter permease subunit [Pirellulales bacterium]|nr:efflux RND transporter permease subunit [Pirellulales bacterium]